LSSIPAYQGLGTTKVTNEALIRTSLVLTSKGKESARAVCSYSVRSTRMGSIDATLRAGR
jgi:hypothetical protein